MHTSSCEWRNVVGNDGEYMVSNTGKVMSFKNTKRPTILKAYPNNQGYLRVNLRKNKKTKQFFVHRLVANAFIGALPKNMVVNHKDGNRINNCVTNLEIVTQSENQLHSYYELGNIVKPVIMLDKTSYEFIKEFPSISKASKELNIHDTNIFKVCSNKRHSTGGYSWVFKDDYNEEFIEKKKKRMQEGRGRKKVFQVDPYTGDVIKEFPGVAIAKRETGILAIGHCVLGTIKTAGGYIWRYEK